MRLTETPESLLYPTWSPDGSRNLTSSIVILAVPRGTLFTPVPSKDNRTIFCVLSIEESDLWLLTLDERADR